jgi:hypothetical protein
MSAARRKKLQVIYVDAATATPPPPHTQHVFFALANAKNKEPAARAPYASCYITF